MGIIRMNVVVVSKFKSMRPLHKLFESEDAAVK